MLTPEWWTWVDLLATSKNSDENSPISPIITTPPISSILVHHSPPLYIYGIRNNELR